MAERVVHQTEAPAGAEVKTPGVEKKFKFASPIDAGIAMLGLFSLLNAKAVKITTTDKGPSNEDIEKAVQKSPVIGIENTISLLRKNERNVATPQYEIE